MRYYLDTEFCEDGKTIDLISIGIVAEDGREYYAVSQEAQLNRVNPWVRANVLPHLPPYGAPEWKTRQQIRDDVRSLTAGDDAPEFWAYYADYDWVVFCQLFGTMKDLPNRFPMFCMDIKQLAVMKGNPSLPPQESNEHDALADARWNKLAHDRLAKLGEVKP